MTVYFVFFVIAYQVYFTQLPIYNSASSTLPGPNPDNCVSFCLLSERALQLSQVSQHACGDPHSVHRGEATDWERRNWVREDANGRPPSDYCFLTC